MNTLFRNSALFAGLLILSTLANVAHAQDRPAQDVGYLDLQMVDAWFDTEATLEVNVKEWYWLEPWQ